MNARAMAGLVSVNAAAGAALWAWAAAGWPGRPNPLLDGNGYFCEALRAGLVKQPANTWSCLAFVLVGLFLAARSRSRRAALFALLISIIGPASMALHAGMTHWGGVADVVSMFLFIGFAICHNAARLQPRFAADFGAFYGACSAALTAVAATIPQFTEVLFGLLIGGFILTEVRRGPRACDRRLLAASAALFAAGFACWIPSTRTTSPWCSPYSYFQGHACWHVLCALAAGAVYLYLEPELGNPLDAGRQSTYT